MYKLLTILIGTLICSHASAQLGLTKQQLIDKFGSGYEEVYKGRKLFMQYLSYKGDSKGLYQEMKEYSFGSDQKCNSMNIVTPRRFKAEWLKKFSKFEGGGTDWYDTKNHYIWSIYDDGEDGYIVITCSNGKL